jgi:exodeoxyribonuclease V alpha subunit
MGINVRIVAPTGKAAARAAEITGVAATTIHRLLGAPVGGTRAAGPIRGGLLVVEEASMLGQDVAAWLAINIKPSGSLRMVFLGDDQQLPSVAPGRILSDLVQSGVVPIARLTAVHRQRGGSRIVQQANRVLRGEPLLDGETHDWTHVELPADAGDARALVLRTVRDVIAQERHSVLRDTTFDPRREMQVLSPTAVGALGSVALNSGLRAILNARGELGPFLHGHQQARVGDRVVCMRNDYSVFPQGLMNGEQGVVRAMSGQEITTLLDDGRVVRTRGVQNSRLALGFASTVHRAQGSEYPVVVLVYHRTHGRLLDRRLFYTAITRAKQRVILCADPAALEASAAGVRLMQRQSELLARLRTRIAMRAG